MSHFPYESFKIIYKIEKDTDIKIFGKKFVKNNKDNCLLKYENLIFPLKEYFPLKYIEKKEIDRLEIILIELEDIQNKNYMFHECNLLEKLFFNELNEKYAKNKIDKNNNVDNEIGVKNNSNKQNEEEYNEIFSESNNININENKLYPRDSLTSEIIKSNIQEFILNVPILSFYKVKMKKMFYGCSSLVSLPDISNWNTKEVTDMSKIFYGCSLLESLPDISKWNIDNVRNINSLFWECSSLISLPDLSKWNTNKVIDISYLFFGCSLLLKLPDL